MSKNNIVVEADAGVHRISRHIYGHFSEHLGRCIYDGFWVGEDSPIAHTRGIRRDIVEALRAIRIPNLRWPGGCFADEYHWMDGIGPRSERPTMVNTHWGGVSDNNHFGTHEFMDLCAQLGAEPYISANVGSGTVHEMQQWVEYLSLDRIGPMAELRAQHGRREPWQIKYWGVGNESWACGGHMRAEYYADLYRRYATFCRNYGDNKLYKIACGPGNALATPEEDYHWTEVLMREAGRYMDGLSLHYYTIAGPGWKEKGSATDFAEDAWFSALYKARHMDELIRRHGAIMDRYDPEKRVGLIVDEWGTWHDVEPGTHPGFLYMQNSLRDALVAAITLNIFNKHSERVRMANIAQTVNVLQAMVLTEGEKRLLTPTYHVFDLYKVHHDATMLPLHIECERYAGADADMPVIHASASLDAEKKIHLSLCNVHDSESKELRCQLRGAAPTEVTGQVLTGPAINAHNTFEQPDLVRPVEFDSYSLHGDVLTIEMPARALVALELS